MLIENTFYLEHLFLLSIYLYLPKAIFNLNNFLLKQGLYW